MERVAQERVLKMDEYDILFDIITFGVMVLCIFGIIYAMTDILNNNNTISLGDEVVTSNEYNVYFNDSFSGRIIVTKDFMYTVRDIDGNERVFEEKWLVKVNRE